MTRTLVRRAALAGTAFLVGVVLSACGSTDSGSAPNGSMPGMSNGTSIGPTGSAAAGLDQADAVFAQQMIPHHQQAVAMAALAETRAADSEVKKLAAQIKAAQDPEISTMTGWMSTWGMPAPQASMGGMDMGGAAMPGMMSGDEMAKLTAASGTTFDKEFLHLMIQHHQGAITMAKDEIGTGKNADALTLAKQIVTAQQAEITTMKGILARL